MCLLHLLVTISHQYNLALTVAHLNHQLRDADSQADADFVRQLAHRWQLPAVVESHNVAALAATRKQSIEETARQVRYAFLWRVAQQTEATKVAVGHNADDQAETVLMHFIRGSGLSGLRGMLPSINLSTLRLHLDDTSSLLPHAAPRLIRPLLDISRTSIETYCRQNDLSPRRDYTNQDTTYFRNRLRHQLIPRLETYNPNIRQVLRHTANVVAADVEILTEQLNRAWATVVEDESPQKVVFNLARWQNLPLGHKRGTLRRAVQRLRRSLRDISFIHVENAIAVLEKGQTGAQATLPQNLMLTVGYQTFAVAPANEPVAPDQPDRPQMREGEIVELNLPGNTRLPGTNWQLRAKLIPRKNIDFEAVKQVGRREAYLDAQAVGQNAVLRTRRPGDTFCPLGMGGHSKKVNEFMIDQKIPAGQRNAIPLLVSENRVLWVCGYRPDERARLKPTSERALYLKFEPQ